MRCGVAGGPEGKSCVVPKQGGAGIGKDEGAIGERGAVGFVAALGKAARNGTGGVQGGVEPGDGAGMSGGIEIGTVGGATAFRAGPMTGGESDGLVMEEQFRIVAWGHERAFAALEAGQAADPCPVAPAAVGQTMFVVQDAAVAHESPPRGMREEL